MNKNIEKLLWFFLSLVFISYFILLTIDAGLPWIFIVVGSILLETGFWIIYGVLKKIDKHKEIHGGLFGYVCPKCKNRLKITEHKNHIEYDCIICGWHKNKKI